MAKKGSNSNKVSKASSGTRHISKARHTLRRIKMKIARWEKYKADGKPAWTAKNEKEGKSRNKSRYNNWDTTGLKKHVEFLEAVIKQGKKSKGLAGTA